MPPLERLDQNRYGGTPAATPAGGLGLQNVSPAVTPMGAPTPQAGHTPGPRMGKRCAGLLLSSICNTRQLAQTALF